MQTQAPVETRHLYVRKLPVETYELILRGAGARRITVPDYLGRLIELMAFVQAVVENGNEKAAVDALRKKLRALGLEPVRF